MLLLVWLFALDVIPGMIYWRRMHDINHQPNTPRCESPASETTDVSLTPTLRSSAFQDQDDGDTHQATRWVVARDERLNNVVWEHDSDTDPDKTGKEIPSGILKHDTTYYWAVRHQDRHGEWSDFADAWWFRTKPIEPPNHRPNAPRCESPASEATDVSLTPTLRSSAFQDQDDGDTHQATHWVVARDEHLNNVVWEHDSDTDPDKTGKEVPSGILKHDTKYYWAVRHQDRHGEWSDFADARWFRTKPDQPLHGKLLLLFIYTDTYRSEKGGLRHELKMIQEKYADQLIGQSVMVLSNDSLSPRAWNPEDSLPRNLSPFRGADIEDTFETAFKALDRLAERCDEASRRFETILVWHSESNLDNDPEQRVRPPTERKIYLAWAGLESSFRSNRLANVFKGKLLRLDEKNPTETEDVLANFVGYRLLDLSGESP